MTESSRAMDQWCRHGEKTIANQVELAAATSSASPTVSLSAFLYCLLASAAMLVAGCPPEQQPMQASRSRASVALRVVVVNEPAVTEAINRLKGEWAERSGGELSATSKDWKELAEAKQLDADVLVFPSRYMGELCVRGWLQPIRASVLESEEFNAADIFPLVRRELMRWGGETIALPLGIVIAGANDADNVPPGTSVLASAAPALVSSEGEAILFEPQTMKPRIDGPMFVDALQQLVEAGGKRADFGIDFAHWVPVFGFADPMLAVSAETRNGASASKLIAWLASAETGTQLAHAAGARLPVRRSVPVSATGSGQDSGSRGTKLTDVFAKTMNGDKCLLVPRIPGVDDYC